MGEGINMGEHRGINILRHKDMGEHSNPSKKHGRIDDGAWRYQWAFFWSRRTGWTINIRKLDNPRKLFFSFWGGGYRVTDSVFFSGLSDNPVSSTQVSIMFACWWLICQAWRVLEPPKTIRTASEEAGHPALQGALSGEVPRVSDGHLITWWTMVYGGYNLHNYSSWVL